MISQLMFDQQYQSVEYEMKNDSVKLTEDQLSQRYVRSLSFYFGNLTNAGLETFT